VLLSVLFWNKHPLCVIYFLKDAKSAPTFNDARSSSNKNLVFFYGFQLAER
jgi:hypothetical protein